MKSFVFSRTKWKNEKNSAINSRTLRVEGLESRLMLSTFTWDGSSGDKKWSTAANWEGNVAPNASQQNPIDLVFQGNYKETNNDYLISDTINSIEFDSSNFVIKGLPFKISSKISLSTSNITGIDIQAGVNLAVASPGHVEMDVPGSSMMTISGAITGTGGLDKTHAGKLVLSATNTFSGSTLIQDGVIAMGAQNALPSGSSVTMGGYNHSTELDLQGYDQTFDSLTGDSTSSIDLYSKNLLNNNGRLTLNITTGHTATFSGCITGNSDSSKWGTLYLQGGGTLNLSSAGSSANTWANLLIDGSTLICNGGDNKTIPYDSNLQIQNSGTLNLNGNKTQVKGIVVNGGVITDTSNNLTATTFTINNNLDISLSGLSETLGKTKLALKKTGTGRLTLPSANNYSGGTELAGGITSFVSGGLGSSGTISITANSTLTWNGHTNDISARLRVSDNVTAKLGFYDGGLKSQSQF
jgi:autotransporter-associated beta strand protein